MYQQVNHRYLQVHYRYLQVNYRYQQVPVYISTGIYPRINQQIYLNRQVIYDNLTSPGTIVQKTLNWEMVVKTRESPIRYTHAGNTECDFV